MDLLAERHGTRNSDDDFYMENFDVGIFESAPVDIVNNDGVNGTNDGGDNDNGNENMEDNANVLYDDINYDNDSVIVVSSDDEDDEVDHGIVAVSNSRTVVQTYVFTITRRVRYVDNRVVDSRVISVEQDFFQHGE